MIWPRKIYGAYPIAQDLMQRSVDPVALKSYGYAHVVKRGGIVPALRGAKESAIHARAKRDLLHHRTLYMPYGWQSHLLFDRG